METDFLRDMDALSRVEIQKYQLKKLQEQGIYLSSHSPYYQRIFKENRILPDYFKTLDDLKRVPLTDTYRIGESQDTSPPFGEFLCVPEKDIVKYFRTSGTTYKPRNFAYTWFDWWQVSVEMLARLKYSCGIRAKDRVLIAFPYSTYIAFWTSHYACEKLGCMVIPGGGTSAIESIKLMQDIKVTALCATPTYVNLLGNAAEEHRLNLRDIPLKTIHCAGEPLAAVPGSRAGLEEIWQAKVYDSYGCNEGACVLAGECEAQDGLHFSEGVLIPEILDPQGNRVKAGEPGELVISNVVSKTMPLLRFRTGDRVTYTDEPCSCGRQTIRIRVVGRIDDTL